MTRSTDMTIISTHSTWPAGIIVLWERACSFRMSALSTILAVLPGRTFMVRVSVDCAAMNADFMGTVEFHVARLIAPETDYWGRRRSWFCRGKIPGAIAKLKS